MENYEKAYHNEQGNTNNNSNQLLPSEWYDKNYVLRRSWTRAESRTQHSGMTTILIKILVESFAFSETTWRKEKRRQQTTTAK